MMRMIEVDPDELVLSTEPSRSGSAKQFEERLRASIEEIGLVEPIKVATLPGGDYLVVDGTMRLKAVQTIREHEPNTFTTIPAYVVDYKQRFELRFQTDIYQDLLPSQLAVLVEHLHEREHVRKVDIARYIGVSPPTLRNYTGLWRLLQRGGLFARIVDLMDLGVLPASNPYAWLRLTADGLRHVLEENLTDSAEPGGWIDQTLADARGGTATRYPIKYVEAVTSSLDPKHYREGAEVRNAKRDLGLRRGKKKQPRRKPVDQKKVTRHLNRVERDSLDPVLQTAARSLKAYLQ